LALLVGSYPNKKGVPIGATYDGQRKGDPIDATNETGAGVRPGFGINNEYIHATSEPTQGVKPDLGINAGGIHASSEAKVHHVIEFMHYAVFWQVFDDFMQCD
jgi:hypothetical protein